MATTTNFGLTKPTVGGDSDAWGGYLNTDLNVIDAVLCRGVNVLINGDFRINQRAYVSAAALASGSYGHDRWKGGASGGNYSFTQLASPTTITIAASKSLIQVVEDKNVVGGSYVLSWTGTAVARYAINSATPAGTFAVSPILITGQTAGTTMSVEFTGANAVGTSAVGTNTGTLGLVKLETGAAATAVTPFVPDDYEVSLAKCQRYCYVWANSASFQRIAFGQFVTTTRIDAWRQFPVILRGTPTVAYSTATDFTGDDGVSNFTASAMSHAGLQPDGCMVTATVSAGVLHTPAMLEANGSAAAKITWDAEL